MTLVCWNAMILWHYFQEIPEDGLNLCEILGKTKSKDWETIPEKRLLGPDKGRGGILPDEITFHRVFFAVAPVLDC